MRQGTTPTHIFDLPFDTGDVERLEITYEQNDKVVLQKQKNDCTLEGNEVSVKLTQEETFLFEAGTNIIAQIHAVSVYGDAVNSDEVYIRCLESRSGEVL